MTSNQQLSHPIPKNFIRFSIRLNSVKRSRSSRCRHGLCCLVTWLKLRIRRNTNFYIFVINRTLQVIQRKLNVDKVNAWNWWNKWLKSSSDVSLTQINFSTRHATKPSQNALCNWKEPLRIGLCYCWMTELQSNRIYSAWIEMLPWRKKKPPFEWLWKFAENSNEMSLLFA